MVFSCLDSPTVIDHLPLNDQCTMYSTFRYPKALWSSINDRGSIFTFNPLVYRLGVNLLDQTPLRVQVVFYLTGGHGQDVMKNDLYASFVRHAAVRWGVYDCLG